MGTNERILTIKEQIADLEAILGSISEERANIANARKQIEGLVAEQPQNENRLMIAANYITQARVYTTNVENYLERGIKVLTQLYHNQGSLNKDEDDE